MAKMEPFSNDSGTDDNKLHKTSGYVQTIVTLHNMRDRAKETVESLQENGLSERVQNGWDRTRRAVSTKARNFFSHPEDVYCDHIPQKYAYMFRPKSQWEFVLLSGIVCGIEFSYAAETAFVTPIILSLGLNIKFVTMIWCLSPLIGFFLTPILGSLSDTCESRFGRRRPFILSLSIGILLGLILVPNGHHIGIALGDTPNLQNVSNSSNFAKNTLYSNTSLDGTRTYALLKPSDIIIKKNFEKASEIDPAIHPIANSSFQFASSTNSSNIELNASHAQSSIQQNISQRFSREVEEKSPSIVPKTTTGIHMQPWSIAFTVVGTVFLDFCADACQSPSRTYLLDVSLPEDHTRGLSAFTLMAGLGGSIGYMMGAVHWGDTYLGNLLGGQVNVVFLIVTIVFVFCLIATLCCFPEMPLSILKDPKMLSEYQQKLGIGECQEKGNEMEAIGNLKKYGATGEDEQEEKEETNTHEIPNSTTQIKEGSAEVDETNCVSVSSTQNIALTITSDEPSLKEYLRSIVHMPKSIRILCLTNLFSWMSLICYQLYFTDFVGEVVYGGNPQAAEGTDDYKLYQDGVSFGCWGMALFSISCSVYSYFSDALVKRFGAKPVYIGGHLAYTLGMIIMAAARHPVAVILLSPTAGIMYSTLFTMPYLLIAHYHHMQKFRDDKSGAESGVRGIGTDVASISTMMFLAQFILSLTMGSIVEAIGSDVVTVCAAALLSACGAICATQVMYLDM